MNSAKKDQAWKPLPVGTRVQSRTYRKGACGTVKERLDDSMSGRARYGVVMDDDTNNTADFSRWELRRMKRTESRYTPTIKHEVAL